MCWTWIVFIEYWTTHKEVFYTSSIVHRLSSVPFQAGLANYTMYVDLTEYLLNIFLKQESLTLWREKHKICLYNDVGFLKSYRNRKGTIAAKYMLWRRRLGNPNIALVWMMNGSRHWKARLTAAFIHHCGRNTKMPGANTPYCSSLSPAKALWKLTIKQTNQ